MELDKVLNDFKIYKVNVEGRSESSVNLYLSHIKEFCKDMNITNYEEFINVKAQIIKDWLVSQAQKGNEPTTRNNKLSAIKQIYSYLELEKEIDVDRRIDKIPNAKTSTKEVKYADKDIANQLIKCTKNQRTKAAISIIECTGVRFSELLQITRKDIERGYATIVGKGNKERTIWFNDDCIKICNKYINGKWKKIIDDTKVNTDLLFISNNGKILTKQSFSTTLKTCSRRIGLYWADEMSPHKLRHGFITEKLNDGVPIQIVRDAVGHSNISTTNKYSHSKDDAVKQVMLNNYSFMERKEQ